MEIVTRGLFKFDPKKTYVLIDENKTEHGTLELDGQKVVATLKNPDPKGEDDYKEFENELDLQHWLDDEGYIITSDSVRWVTYNPNPENSKANDCSIRAYCAAENMKWDDAYDVATQYGKAYHFMPNDSTTCSKILEEEFGYTLHKLTKEQKGMTVKEFAISHPEGIYVLNMSKHLVTVIDGEYYDSWDSGEKKISGYWSK